MREPPRAGSTTAEMQGPVGLDGRETAASPSGSRGRGWCRVRGGGCLSGNWQTWGKYVDETVAWEMLLHITHPRRLSITNYQSRTISFLSRSQKMKLSALC